MRALAVDALGAFEAVVQLLAGLLGERAHLAPHLARNRLPKRCHCWSSCSGWRLWCEGRATNRSLAGFMVERQLMGTKSRDS